MTSIQVEKMLLDLVPGKTYDLAKLAKRAGYAYHVHDLVNIAKALGCFKIDMDARFTKVIWWITKRN